MAHVGIFDGDALVIGDDTVSSTDGTMPKQERRFGPNDVVEIVFTSGTTGEPKGVMHSVQHADGLHGAVLRAAQDLA